MQVGIIADDPGQRLFHVASPFVREVGKIVERVGPWRPRLGAGRAAECPLETTTYTLTVVLLDGSTTTQTVTIGIDYKR